MKLVFGNSKPRALRRCWLNVYLRRGTTGQASKFRRALHVADEASFQTKASEQGWAGFRRGRVVVDLGDRGFVRKPDAVVGPDDAQRHRDLRIDPPGRGNLRREPGDIPRLR